MNKTSIQKMIMEFEKKFKELEITDKKSRDKTWDELYVNLEGKISLLKEILSNSIPLIPEISDSYDAGKLDEKFSLMFDNPKGRYINSLKFYI